ncbi:MAG: hypothetical protein IRY95_05260, partial [Clostridia bacterium]|nr:hypothetical protein [Clostridia bacterium]
MGSSARGWEGGNGVVDIVMPKWGLTMEEGTIVEWLKQVGEPVREGEPVLVVETEKASGEVEAPASG